MTSTTNFIHAKSAFKTHRSAHLGVRRGPVVRIIDQFLIWQERHHDRKRLAEMPDYLLKDIGISRADAEQEARKPFWRA